MMDKGEESIQGHYLQTDIIKHFRGLWSCLQRHLKCAMWMFPTLDRCPAYNTFILKGTNFFLHVHLSPLYLLCLMKRKTVSLSAMTLNEKIYSLSWFSFSNVLHMVK